MSIDNTKYGIIAYASNNIGDEIQSIAQMRFLPRIDYYIARDRIKQFIPNNPDEKIKIIMNAWWMQQMENFPPPDSIIPLPISMHIRREICEKQFLDNINVHDWFINNSPIGCRDTATLKRLNEAGIPSYFSSCLTITLIGNESIKNKSDKYVLCVNLTDNELKIIRERSNYPVRTFFKTFQGGSMKKRLMLAKCILYIIHNAHCVITRALHTALPCLPFNTPVLLFEVKPNPNGNYERFYGNSELCNCMKPIDFINNPNIYDINNPPENPKIYNKLKNKLINTCVEFTGHDNNKPIFDDDYSPIWDMIDLMQLDEQQLIRNLYYVSEKTLLNAYYNKRNKALDKYYLTDNI